MTRVLAAFAAAVLLALLTEARIAAALWAALGGTPRAAYATERLLSAAVSHALLALAATALAAALGLGLGILATRAAGRALAPLVDRFAAVLQATPPVVVVALAFPTLGFGAAPTALALVAYCTMPILRGTADALAVVPRDAKEAALALGYTPGRLLREVELPLAAPAILRALRVALALAIATAAVGALAGAATLGTPIIIGLQNQNELYILQGAVATAALALAADAMLAGLAVILPRALALAPDAQPGGARKAGMASGDCRSAT